MAKLTLNNIANLQNESTVVSTLAANNAAIVAAMEKTLSRDGTTPNMMESELDMNSNPIINLPAAVGDTEPVRKAEFDQAIEDVQAGEIVFPIDVEDIEGGTNGYVLTGNGIGVDPSYQGFTQSGAGTITRTWLARGRDYINAKDFGVLANSVTDDTVALQAAMDAASAESKALYLPAGNIIIGGTLNVPLRLEMIGAGRANTSLYLSSTTATLFNISTSGSTVKMRDFRILPTTSRTSNSLIYNLTVGCYVMLNDIDVFSCGTCFVTNHPLIQFDINRCTFNNGAANSVTFEIIGCFIGSIRNTSAFAGANGTPFAHVLLRDCKGQLQIENSYFSSANFGMFVIPDLDQVVTLVTGVMAMFDTSVTTNIHIAPTSNGFVERIDLSSGWITTAGGTSCVLAGTANNIAEIVLENNKIINGAHGISATGVRHLAIVGNTMENLGTAISCADCTSGFILGNFLMANITTGVSLTGTTTRYRVGPNEMTGVTGTKIVNTASGDNAILPGNTGAYAAAGTVYRGTGATTPESFTATPTLGASGTLGSLTLGNATSGLLTIQPVAGALGTTTTLIPVNETLVGRATVDTLTNKTLTSAVAAGTWTASGTWTIPAVTLGGTVSGGGNQLNNIIVGTTTPLAGTFTSLTANTSLLVGTGTIGTGAGNGILGAFGATNGTGSGTINGVVSSITRNAGSGGSDIITAYNYSFNDSGTVNVNSSTVFQSSSIYSNSANTSTNNVNFRIGNSITANLASLESMRIALSFFSSAVLTSYTGLRITAPGGTGSATTIRSVVAESGAGYALFSDGIGTSNPVTKTGTSGTIATTESSVIFDPSGAFTVTLPAISTATAGKILHLKTIAAQTVSSASSNVVPLAGGAAGTAILTATAGKWVTLQAGATNWEIMAGN